MKKYLDYKKLIGLAFFLISSTLFLLMEKIIIVRTFSFDRFIMIEVLLGFISFHLFVDYKKIWNFIFDKRYWIGAILFFIIILCRYNGSSVAYYNDVIQPTIREQEYEAIWGNYKNIRGDEFVVVTPGLMSQKLYNKNLNPINESMRATETEVTMFPMLPTKTISILVAPHLWGFLFLPIEQAFSFYWYLPMFLAFFVVFELFLLITNRKKLLSLTGTSLLIFSPTLLWWHSYLILASGSLAVLLLEQFLREVRFKKKLLLALLIGWSGSCYIMTMYPAWQIPFGYLFLGLFVWRIRAYWEFLKWRNLLYIFPALSIILITIIPAILRSQETLALMQNTIYPGKRNSTGGDGWWLNFNYYISVFFGMSPTINSPESAQIISLYPLPMAVGILQSARNYINKRKDQLLNILLAISILMTLWNYLPLKFLSKITLMSLSTPIRSQLIVNVICVLLMIKLLGDYCVDEKLSKKIIKIVLSLLFVVVGMLIMIQYNSEYVSTKKIVVVFIVFSILTALFLLKNTRGRKILCFMLISMSLFSLMTVQPITKGLSVMTNKPVAKEIQKIKRKEPEAVWLGVDSIEMPGYLLANGVRTLNSVNYIPNFKFWRVLDPSGTQENVYNRYAHVTARVSNESVSIQLVSDDCVEIVVDANCLKKLGVNYIFSYNADLEKYSSQEVILKRLYSEDNVSIYGVDE